MENKSELTSKEKKEYIRKSFKVANGKKITTMLQKYWGLGKYKYE